MDSNHVKELIAQYESHGWKLRRVLLSGELECEIGMFGECEALKSDIDAAWFSRRSAGEREAWELRRLSENPYALFEVFEADEIEEPGEEIRAEMEDRMRGKQDIS